MFCFRLFPFGKCDIGNVTGTWRGDRAVEHPPGIGSGDGDAIVMLDVDTIPEEEGVYGGAPDSIWTGGHGKEDLIRIAKAANELIPCKGAIVVSVFMTIATELSTKRSGLSNQQWFVVLST